MIRRFSLGDLDRILAIEHQAFPKSPYDWVTFMNLQWLYPQSFWVYVDRPPDQEEDLLCGYIIFSLNGHIISIAVDPLWRRKRIGTTLIKKIIHHPRTERVWAEVRLSNQAAQAFYLSLGFQIIGRIQDYYGDEDALIVQRPASKPLETP